MNKEFLKVKWMAVTDRNFIMSFFKRPVLWNRIWLITGMVFWGAVIIIFEVLLAPFFLQKQGIRKNTV